MGMAPLGLLLLSLATSVFGFATFLYRTETKRLRERMCIKEGLVLELRKKLREEEDLLRESEERLIANMDARHIQLSRAQHIVDDLGHQRRKPRTALLEIKKACTSPEADLFPCMSDAVRERLLKMCNAGLDASPSTQ